MARIELDNVSLTFHVRQLGRVTLKEYVVRRMFRRSVNPYVQVEALKNVTLRVDAGDRLGILGHNGAGKSTLLKLLAGIYPPTSGRRSVQGRISSLFDIALGFEPEASGWENIAYRGYLQGETPRTIRAKMESIGAFSELGHFLDMPVRYYSAGMLVRLAFSIATAIEPEILLIDEVLSVGDLAFQQKARARMREMIGKAELVILVSHDLPSMAQLCDKVLWMDHGQVRQIGPAGEVIAAYMAHVQGNAGLVGATAAGSLPCRRLPAGREYQAVRWSVPHLPPGFYEVQAAWPARFDQAVDAPYQVFDGNQPVATVRVNQQVPPVGNVIDGVAYQSLGTYRIDSGSLQVELSNRATRDVAAASVRVVPLDRPQPLVVDDGHAGYQQEGDAWLARLVRDAFGGSVRVAPAGDGAHRARWEFVGLEPGEYDVYASWVPQEDAAADAPFHLWDGPQHRATIRINQRVAATDKFIGGVAFRHLGRWPIQSGMLRVVLTNDASGAVIADAVHVSRVQRLPAIVRTAADVLPTATLVGRAA
ncbi:MAG: ATP-binding cassette domain-containing protein [Gemmataceae bacterium]|nr:ATP-binding cassette domain-containing protein [Gemmataceae bacterium]MDW8267386.1 ATP-binding cassette domain-containing protein [Gemmataceae bacterium]